MPYIPIAKARGFTAGFGKDHLRAKSLASIFKLMLALAFFCTFICRKNCYLYHFLDSSFQEKQFIFRVLH